jgi:hypothetical protein
MVTALYAGEGSEPGSGALSGMPWLADGEVTKKEVYTLKPGDMVAYDECFLSLAGNADLVGIGIIRDSAFYWVLDGREYGPYLNRCWLEDARGQSKWGFAGEKDDGWYVQIDGREEMGPYQQASSPYYSGVWQYACKNLDGWRMSIDGNEFGPYLEVGRFVVDSQAAQWSFSARTPDGWVIQSSAGSSGPFNQVKWLDYYAGRRFGFVADAPDGWHVNMDGKDYGPFTEVQGPRFSGDERTWAFRARDLEGWRAVVSGKVYGPYENVWNIELSRDGGAWAIGYGRGQDWYELLNGDKTLGPFNSNYAPGFSRDGRRWGFGLKQSDDWYVTLSDSGRCGPYKDVRSFEFSRDGSKWAACTRKDAGWFVTMNGSDYGPFDSTVLGSTFSSSDGTRWGFTARRKDGWHLILNSGREYGPYDQVSRPQFGGQGSNWWARTKTGSSYGVVINGREFGPYGSEVGLDFDSQYKHWAFECVENSQHFVVADGSAHGPFRAVTWPFFPESSASFLIWVQKDDGWYLLAGDKEFGPCDDQYGVSGSGDDWACIMESDGQDYAVIDGKIAGSNVLKLTYVPSQLGAGYFCWFTLEGRDIYCCRVPTRAPGISVGTGALRGPQLKRKPRNAGTKEPGKTK